MCYSALVKQNLKELAHQYGAIIIREQVDDYLRASAADSKRFPPPAERIFPHHFAPVIFKRAGQRVCELMRYSAFPPPLFGNARAYTSFNARRDNLTSPFWASAFMQHHGFVVLEAFYEWVAVKDLLQAGVVTLREVEAEFARQAEERKAKLLAAGKKYRPTPTEKKAAADRQIVIEFKPADGHDLVVPVIFNYAPSSDGPGGRPEAGFAIITDDPPSEVLEAGHDRCPLILNATACEAWLHPEAASAQALLTLLTQQKRLVFRHKLAEAA